MTPTDDKRERDQLLAEIEGLVEQLNAANDALVQIAGPVAVLADNSGEGRIRMALHRVNQMEEVIDRLTCDSDGILEGELFRPAMLRFIRHRGLSSPRFARIYWDLRALTEERERKGRT